MPQLKTDTSLGVLSSSTHMPLTIRFHHQCLCLLGIVQSLFLCSANGQSTPAFYDLPPLPGDDISYAEDVSDDGTVVVGYSYSSSGVSTAVRWRVSALIVASGCSTPTPYLQAIATATNSDGSIFVGRAVQSSNPYREVGHRWDRDCGATSLGLLPGGIFSVPYSISADGSVVIGQADSNVLPGNGRGFYWTSSTGIVELPALVLGGITDAISISSNGRTIVGGSRNAAGGYVPVRWDDFGQPVALPLFAGDTGGEARGASSDGQYICGYSSNYPNLRAVRWGASGVSDLGPFNGGSAYQTYGNTISDDGNVVGGGNGCRAFVWTPHSGTRDLRQVLASFNLPVGGWRLHEVYGMSRDGKTFVGWGRNGVGAVRGWVAVIPAMPQAFVCEVDYDDGSGLGVPDGGVTVDDLLYYLFAFEAGWPAADIDDGSGQGGPDCGVTIDDLLYFLARFEAGC